MVINRSSGGTCSFYELTDLYLEKGRGFPEAIQSFRSASSYGPGDGVPPNLKCIVANLSDDQHGTKALVAHLEKHGFKKICTYPGNSSRTMHVYMRGVTACRKLTLKKSR